MMRIAANKRAPSARGIFSPLRHAVFRRIWTASLLSNLGILVLGVGAAWTMTQISSSADMVALVQTSLMLPVALVSTPAGAIADMFDRRFVGIVALSIALAGSISLSALAWLGLVTPILLLFARFIIGSGMALFGPAWQASVSEQNGDSSPPPLKALDLLTAGTADSGKGIAHTISDVSGRDPCDHHLETARTEGLDRTPVHQHRPGNGKGPPKTEVERLWPEQDDPLSVSSSTPVRHGGSTGRQGLPIQP
jgi:Transmembrane secretion effector